MARDLNANNPRTWGSPYPQTCGVGELSCGINRCRHIDEFHEADQVERPPKAHHHAGRTEDSEEIARRMPVESSFQKFYAVPSVQALSNLTLDPYRFVLSYPNLAVWFEKRTTRLADAGGDRIPRQDT